MVTALDLMFVLLVLLQVGDFVTTQRALVLGAVEANPLLLALKHWISERSFHIGRWVWLAAPKCVVIVLLVLLREAALVGDQGIALAMFALMVWYTWWVLRNWALIRHLKNLRP